MALHSTGILRFRRVIIVVIKLGLDNLLKERNVGGGQMLVIILIGVLVHVILKAVSFRLLDIFSLLSVHVLFSDVVGLAQVVLQIEI